MRLTQAADALQVNPTYLSREFARYFDNLSFGEYIRKLRIDKALDLLDTTAYPMAEIAYLTGFSDQSHYHPHLQAAHRPEPTRGVAFSRVDAFFASPAQPFHRLPQGRALH